jgi:alkanesulfonate monooxygenase SsuD/methylene tetrahydromethanopterin reductase-like flavin-dependent oxidoreductase (luciferase family)
MNAPQMDVTSNGERSMRIGIGLPAAVPGVDATTIATWAADAERLGFASVGVIDRLVYDNLEPLTTLAAAAATTRRVELLTTVLNAGWRANPVLLAKQLASVDLLSGGRLTTGIGLGGWPEDYAASGVSLDGRGARLDADIATMRKVWAGEITGHSGPTRRLAEGRPALLFGGLVPAAHRRAATQGDGWVAPFVGHDVLVAGIDAVRREWEDQRRPGTPRIVTGRYVSLGDDATADARRYFGHYYGPEAVDTVLADTATTVEELHGLLERLETAGVTDVVLHPCTADPETVPLIADAIARRERPSGDDVEEIPRRGVDSPASVH